MTIAEQLKKYGPRMEVFLEDGEDPDDEHALYWVGVKERYHGMKSEVRFADRMQKEIAYLIKDLLCDVSIPEDLIS